MSKAQTVQKAAQTAAEQPLPMKIDVKIGSIRPDGNVRAYASVNLNDCFAIRNVKIVDSTKGLFIAMPSYKAGNGEYKDICFPVTKEFREQLNQAVVDAYQQALTQSQAQGRQLMEQASQPEQQPGMQMAGL
ncbi:SpoVG family protein [Clostridium sp. FS41]|uniref:SpoVG family protein n=1 Tax=Clostridium sp. FS41 TaxID=1609975 RepID=UPI0005D3EBC8|nr:SpoVG family protein [Clostridium sp. FS41]KJJ71744.1 putative septation protein SpoVG [Clostridium sp. FS41]